MPFIYGINVMVAYWPSKPNVAVRVCYTVPRAPIGLAVWIREKPKPDQKENLKQTSIPNTWLRALTITKSWIMWYM